MFRKIARPMLASVFIADGVDTLVHTDTHAPGTAATLKGVAAVTPGAWGRFIPSNPALVTRVLGVVKVVSGSTLALGKAQRLSAAALAVSTVPTLLGRYAFWNAEDDADKSQRRTGFFTRIGLLGGLLITVSDTQGRPDLVWRTQHAAKVANKKVRAALPGPSETEALYGKAQERAGEVVGQAKTLAASGVSAAEGAIDKTSTAATGFWEDKGRDMVADAAEWASETFASAQEAAAGYLDSAQEFIADNKDDWLGAFSDNAQAVKHKAVQAAHAAQEKADEAAHRAAGQSGRYMKKAQAAAKKAEKARERALSILAKKF